MGYSRTGNQAGQFPISAPVGQLYSPQGGAANPAAPVSRPNAELTLNGVRLTIDVRSMTGQNIIDMMNTAPGIVASINGSGAIYVTGINSIAGNVELRSMLGI